MSRSRLKYQQFIAEADKLREEAEIYAEQIKGPARKKLHNRISIAWIRKDLRTLRTLVKEARTQVESLNSNNGIAAD